MQDFDKDTPIFAIAAAAELSGMHPQTLRQYDRLGLVIPNRTRGQSRRYSLRNITQLRQVQELSEAGVSLEGIRRILQLQLQVDELSERVRMLEATLHQELERRPGTRIFAAAPEGNVVSLRFGRHREKSGAIVRWRQF